MKLNYLHLPTLLHHHAIRGEPLAKFFVFSTLIAFKSTALKLVTDMASYRVLIYLDANCVQVLAPNNLNGVNKGVHHPGEHIGHIKMEWAAKLARIIDELIDTNTLNTVCFDCYLSDGDTTHARKGYNVQ